MTNSGLVKATVTDEPMALFWKQMLPNLTVRSDVVVRPDGGYGLGGPQEQPEAARRAEPVRQDPQGRHALRQRDPAALSEEREVS